MVTKERIEQQIKSQRQNFEMLQKVCEQHVEKAIEKKREAENEFARQRGISEGLQIVLQNVTKYVRENERPDPYLIRGMVVNIIEAFKPQLAQAESRIESFGTMQEIFRAEAGQHQAKIRGLTVQMQQALELAEREEAAKAAAKAEKSGKKPRTDSKSKKVVSMDSKRSDK
jgi:hypothetical protein